MIESDWDREPIFKKELTKLFLAYNRQSGESLIKAKSALLSETLVGLPTNRIKAFFAYIRANEDTLPTDSRMLHILRATTEKFGIKTKNLLTQENHSFGPKERLQIEEMAMKYPSFIPLLQELLDGNETCPSETWILKFWKAMKDKKNFNISEHWIEKK